MADDSVDSPSHEDGEQGVRSTRLAYLLGSSGVLAQAGDDIAVLLPPSTAPPPATQAAPAAPAAPTSSPAGDGGSTGGQCCGAYPADVLTAALGTAVDPKEVWAAIGAERRQEIARSLTRDGAQARRDLLKKSAWATAPEMVLLDEVGESERAALARKMLETRSAITAADDVRRSAEAELAQQRVALAGVLRDTFEEANNQMRTWTRLARLGKVMLVLATIFSAFGIAAAIVFAARGELGEVETPIIIFALAVFAISPAVLLLRERPLEGLDKWTPSGLVGGEEKGEADGEGSGSGTAAATTTTT